MCTVVADSVPPLQRWLNAPSLNESVVLDTGRVKLRASGHAALVREHASSGIGRRETFIR